MTGAAISALLEAAESFFAERIDRFELISAKARALDIAAGTICEARSGRLLRWTGKTPNWRGSPPKIS